MKSKNTIKDFSIITLGMFIVSAAVYFFLIPSEIVVGSISGLSMVLSQLLGIPISLITFILNAILLVIGFIFRKARFTLVNVVIAGIAVGIIAPIIGTPIGIAVYGGLTGTISDVAVVWLKQSGASIFAASFLPKLANNLVDKIGSCLIIYLLIKSMPATLKPACLLQRKAKA